MASDAPSAAAPPRGPAAGWLGLLLVLALVLAKVAYWPLPASTWVGLRDYARDLAVSCFADALFGLGVGLAAAAALAVCEPWPRLRTAVWRSLVAFAVVCVVFAVASIQIFAFLRSPLTYSLLYLAGDMKSMRSSMGTFVTPAIGAAFVLAPLAFLGALRAAARRPSPLAAWRGRLVAAAALAAWALFVRHAYAERWADRDNHRIARSPHWDLAVSYVDEWLGRGTPSLDLAFPPEDVADFTPPARSRSVYPRGLDLRERPRNVLLVVLESTGARYLSLYGSPYPTTPNLVREAAHALVFDNIHCHAGMTANALASLTLSIFPYMTWREYTQEYPDFPGTTLADVFKARGYRTAYVHSGELAYVNQGNFLKNRGFDTFWDMAVLGPDKMISSWGGYERLLVDGVLRFADQDPSRPFFAVAWGVESHHPYEPSPEHKEVHFFENRPLPPDDYDLGRYLNTLHSADEQIGRLLAGLRERGLDKDTLVVITGDHGEAFGDPHPTWGHGGRLYQENVHVPLVIWSPRLVPSGSRVPTIGGHVDVNPTVTDLMGLPPAPSWHGRSLFARERPPRTYFFAANDDYLLGVRENDWKYIYDVTQGREELYDLAADPLEQRNRAGEEPDRCRRLRQRLAAWKAHVGRELAEVRRARGMD